MRQAINKIDRLLEEAKKVDPNELRRAAGYDFVYTSNPNENFLSMLNPLKNDAVAMDDLDQRAKVLGIDKNFLAKNMAIHDSDSSGYVVDDPKLAGYASKLHPEHVNFGNTVGSPKRLLPDVLALGALGGALGYGINDEMGAVIGAGAGAAIAPAGSYMGYKQGQEIYNRHQKGK